MTHTEPTLDGMPEIPPAWVRPDEGVLDGILADFTGRYAPFDVALNPTMLARLMPCQRAGRVFSGFRFTCAPGSKGRSKPVVVQTTDDEDDVVIVLMPLNLPEQVQT